MSKFETATIDFLDKKYIPLEQKYKLIIAAAVLILTILIFFFTFFKPHSDELTRLNKEKVTLANKLEKVKKKARSKERLQKELEETQVVFEEASKLLPKEKEIPQLLRDISALGRNAGLDFLAFKPGKDTPKDFYAEIPVNIKVKGPYHNLGFFLDQVSKLERIVTVDNIKMGGPKMDAGEMLLASSCTLKTYRFTNKEMPKKKKKKK